MSYPTYIDDQTLEYTDFNQLASQTVPRFDNSTERDAVLDTVEAGQLCYLADSGYQRYTTGSGWVALIPVPAGGTTGQILAKASDDDYDLVWITP